jgi:hypothetical protein
MSYVAITAHWINRDWGLCHCTLACRAKEGRSQAVDHLRELEVDLDRFHLEWVDIVAVVTDTEATMQSAGRLLVTKSRDSGGKTVHHGCADHILNLTTKLC